MGKGEPQCGPVNNTILTCKSCKKLCDDNCKKFKAQLCAKYNIANVRTRQQFIKARTGATAMMDEKLRYRLPIPLQVEMIKDICAYFNIFAEVVAPITNSEDDEKESGDIDFQWQWYKNDKKVKEFVDYREDISMLIEAAYAANKQSCEFEVFPFKSLYKRYVGNNCRGKHGLKQTKTASPNLKTECDGCGQSGFDMGSVFFECRTCDYDLCNACYGLDGNAIKEKIAAQVKTDKCKKYEVTFDTMEQINERTSYKRGVRRILKNDQDWLKAIGLHRFAHLITIINDTDSVCGIGITSDQIIEACIDDIFTSQNKSVTALQKEQFQIHGDRLLHIIKNEDEFNKMWMDNFNAKIMANKATKDCDENAL